MAEIDEEQVAAALNDIVELELAGAVRYTQYSLMVFGHARIPIISWMRAQAAESLDHATLAGEEVTTLGRNVSLGIGELVGSHHSHVDDMLREMLILERRGIELYTSLLDMVNGRHIALEEYARHGAQRIAPHRRDREDASHEGRRMTRRSSVAPPVIDTASNTASGMLSRQCRPAARCAKVLEPRHRSRPDDATSIVSHQGSGPAWI